MAGLHQTIIRARWLVGGLGESANPAWWRSKASTDAGQRMLARVFARTAPAAVLQTTSRAAEVVHDERIGRRGVFHLFRLPAADEAAIRALLAGPQAADIFGSLAALANQQDRLEALQRLALSSNASGGVGPHRVGSVEDLHHEKALPLICAAYAAGFAAAHPVYPYLGPR